MRRIFFLLLGLIISTTSSYGITNAITIPYLEKMPDIDGLPDKATSSLKWQEFPFILKSHPSNRIRPVRYKIGYNHAFLYLLIEAKSDSLIIRDRAYQNGDGFHLVIARPETNGLASEFYVLRFSPGSKVSKKSAQKGIWYYNIDLSNKSLSAATQFECQSSSGRCYFELILPWSEVYPYHPLFSETIGINLCFVKAVGSHEMNYYFLKYDEKIQCEQSPREYLLSCFAAPRRIDQPFSVVQLSRNNITLGDHAKMKIISVTPTPNSVNYVITISPTDNTVCQTLSQTAALTTGSNKLEIELPTEKLSPGSYRVTWRCSDLSSGEITLTILPAIKPDQEREALQNLKASIPEGDYYTLLFRLQHILKSISALKEYETAGKINAEYTTYSKTLRELRQNSDWLTTQPGISRRAFLSSIDSTLQPYSIKIPRTFQRNKQYPLLVMLHGSGSDDQEILYNNLTEGDFIEMAPYGRGTSNCYSTDNAQIDVKEALDDVIKHFPIDTSRIIIAGFSMGGYGAYRIFYEYPKLFQGIAVFSGHPNLASRWLGEGHPDFLDDNYLTPFQNVPIFVYHNRNDLNCPYELTRQLVTKLTKVGARVEFINTEQGGHNLIDPDNIQHYYQWLAKVIERQ